MKCVYEVKYHKHNKINRGERKLERENFILEAAEAYVDTRRITS